jgi:hypothetical protein
MTRYYDLKKWDKAMHWDELLTFRKMDWMYAQWENESWAIKLWHALNYELKEWIYYPVEEK